MRIAHLLPYSARFPLAKHNGRYDWALTIARWQANQGHDVTVFAAPGSYDDSSIIWKSISSDKDDALTNNTNLINAAYDDPSFHIFHSHYDYLPHTLSDPHDRPLITTQHWFPDKIIAAGLTQHAKHSNARVVPVTQLMREADESFGIPHSHVINHGVNLELFSFEAKPSTNRLLFVGRITPSKGLSEAIMYAKRTGMGLDIIGKKRDKDADYFDGLRPLIDDRQIRYLGAKPHEEVVNYMKNARAVLFPSQEPEAFGLVTIEAQACGTPVILSNVGASSELVIDGKTGFIARTDSEFVTAIGKLAAITRADCRKNAERFDIVSSHEAYLSLYEELTN